MDELVAQFIVEARELVQAAIDDLLALDNDPGNRARLDSAFRAVHTLKGSAGLLNFSVLQDVLHGAEDHLGKVRSGAIFEPEQMDAIVAILEWVDQCVDDVEQSGEIAPALLGRAKGLAAALRDDGAGEAPLAPDGVPDWAVELSRSVPQAAAVALRYQPHAECFFSGDDPIASLGRIPALVHLSIASREDWPALAEFDPFRSKLVFQALSGATIDEVEAVFRFVPDQVEIVPLTPVQAPVDQPAAALPRESAGRTMRVDPSRIDALMDTVGELMIAKNEVADLAAAARALPGGADLARAISTAQKGLDRLAASLYGGVLQTRMVPLSQAFRRLPRMVHDLSRRLGKAVELVIEGDAIEADKSIVDELFEPLLHLVRNALDHGVESPAERLAAAKAPVARLLLRASQLADGIVVSLADDGRGIDPVAIRAAALRKGMITADQAGGMSDRVSVDLLFAAGFSTAASVNDLSGRGVGLDAVRAAIGRVGGTVEIASQIGVGTTFDLRLPVSFALAQLLVVSAGGERFGVPLSAVRETVRLVAGAISLVRGNRAFVLRDRIVPLLSLSALLDLPERSGDTDEVTVLVLALDDQVVGIAVDSIAERMETLTRPLGGLLAGVRGIAGTTVMGDGSVLLVLDVGEMIA